MSQITTARQLFDVAVIRSSHVTPKQVLESGATYIAMDESRAVFTYRAGIGFMVLRDLSEIRMGHAWGVNCNGQPVAYIGEVPGEVDIDYRTACFPIPDDFAQVK